MNLHYSFAIIKCKRLSNAKHVVLLCNVKGKGKVFPLQARCGPEGG